MKAVITQTWELIKGFIFPENTRCINCKRCLFLDNNILCSNCYEKLEFIKEKVYNDNIIRSGNKNDIADNDKNVRETTHFCFDELISVVKYNEVAREVVHNFKFCGGMQVARDCSKLIYEAVLSQEWFKEVDIIIAVPMSKAKLAHRGYNQARLLADSFKACLDKEIDFEFLNKREEIKDQIGLDYKQRQLNMMDSFYIGSKQELIGKNILIIDDVITSGATLDACARVLKEGGANKVFCATFASTQ